VEDIIAMMDKDKKILRAVTPVIIIGHLSYFHKVYLIGLRKTNVI
jgi:hypothetical protein